MFKGKTICVTGHKGFIGSHLVAALKERRAHICSQHNEDVDILFHLGAQTIVGDALKDPVTTFEKNIRSTYLLLEACRKYGTRHVIVASSDKAYGSCVDRYVEETPLDGKFPYDVSKTCADLLAQSYFETYDLPVSITRCANVYGGGDYNWSRLIPGTIRSMMRGEMAILRSNGDATRDYVYIDDVIRAYLLLAEKKIVGEAFNFGTGRPFSALEIVEKLGATPQILDKARSEIPHQSLDSSKAKRLLGWEASTDIDEGLKHTKAWYYEACCVKS